MIDRTFGLWVGLHRTSEGLGWEWLDNSAFKEEDTNWNDGEPSNGWVSSCTRQQDTNWNDGEPSNGCVSNCTIGQQDTNWNDGEPSNGWVSSCTIGQQDTNWYDGEPSNGCVSNCTIGQQDTNWNDGEPSNGWVSSCTIGKQATNWYDGEPSNNWVSVCTIGESDGQCFIYPLGNLLNIKAVFPGIGISIIKKTRRSWDYPIFIKGIPILVSQYLYSDVFLEPPHPCRVTAAPLRIGYPWVKSIGTRSSDDLQWLALDREYWDSSVSNCHRGHMSH